MITFGPSSSSAVSGASASSPKPGLDDIAGKTSAKEAFLEYARMTPAEKMRAAMLKRLGLSEDDLKAMDPKERMRVEEQIKEMIREKVENGGAEQKGAIVDVTA